LVPSDLVRLKGWSVESATVLREGMFFRSNVASLGILYTYLNRTISEYPIYFIEALIDRLALDASYSVLQDRIKTEALENRYAISIASAIAKEAQDETQQSAKCDTWDIGRMTGIFDNGSGGIYYR